MTEAIQRKYSNARMSKIVRHAGLIYLCGQTSSGTPATDIAAQTAEVLSRIDSLLAEAGSDKMHMLSVLIHLSSMEDFDAMNKVWESWLPEGGAPARTTVEARLASSALLVEMTVVASSV